MIASTTFRRRFSCACLLALAAGLSACDALLVEPDAAPLSVALSLSAAAGGSAEAFDAVDRIVVRVLVGGETVEEIEQPFRSSGGDVPVAIRAPARVDGVAVTIQVALSRGRSEEHTS